MTCLVVIWTCKQRKIPFDTPIKVSKRASEAHGTKARLKTDDEISI